MKLEPKNILEGIKNSFWVKETVEKIAEARLQKCRGCDYDSKKRKKKGPERCLYCECFLSLKTRSMSSACPLPEPKWNAVIEDSEVSAQIDKITGNE